MTNCYVLYKYMYLQKWLNPGWALLIKYYYYNSNKLYVNIAIPYWIASYNLPAWLCMI